MHVFENAILIYQGRSAHEVKNNFTIEAPKYFGTSLRMLKLKTNLNRKRRKRIFCAIKPLK